MRIPLPFSSDFTLSIDNCRTNTIDVDRLAALPRGSTITISANVTGYWSDVIDMTLRRDVRSGAWEVALSHSSGGRLRYPDDKYPNRKAIFDDLEAEAGLGRTLIALATFGAQLRPMISRL